MTINIDWEDVAKSAIKVASSAVTAVNPLAGIVVSWAGDTAFAIIDQQKKASDPIAAAQLAGDKVADLIEQLKLGTP